MEIEKFVWGKGDFTIEDDNNSQTFKIQKFNEDQQVVFGWASVSKDINGQLLQDWQGDIIEPEDLEKAAFDFVLNFRDTGERHNPSLRKKGKLVSSIVFTEDVQKALNIPPGTVPVGWFVGFHIDDPKTWQEVKKGKYQMFSIEGKGIRTPIRKARGAILFSTIHKYNPYHDKKGRFTTRGTMNYFSPGKNPVQAKRSIDREKAKAKADGFYDPNKNAEQHLAWWSGKDKQKAGPVIPKKRGVAKIQWSGLTGSEFKQAINDYLPDAAKIGKEVTKKYGNSSLWVDTKDGGDRALLAIYESRGYHAKPKIMSKKDIRDYIDTHDKSPHLYRGARKSSSGQSGKDKMDHFINDDTHYAGLGVYGNGTYAGESPKKGKYAGLNSGFQTARAYASYEKNAIIRCTLDSKSKTGNFSSICNNKREFIRNLTTHHNNGDISDSEYQYLFDLTKDTGRFAALRGYDAFKATDSYSGGANQSRPYWVILNRGAMIIQDERVR